MPTSSPILAAVTASLLLAAAPRAAALNIYETAQNITQLSSLVAALNASNLATALSGTANFTVFAPVNSAFAKLPMGLLADPAKLSTTLQYHVVAGYFLAADVLAAGSLVTLTNDTLYFNMAGRINTYSLITATNTLCDNGVVHLIDTVVEAGVVTIVDVAAAAGLTTLLTLATDAGFAPTFASNVSMNRYTVLAPSNAAFAKLLATNPNAYTWVTNVRNQAGLGTVLAYHVLIPAVYSFGLVAGPVLTLSAQNLTVGLTGNVTFTDNQPVPNVATVTSADNAAYNGVTHVIDTVLLPTGVLPVNDIVTTAAAATNLTTLVAALTSAGLVASLSAPNGPFTVFAPNNTAFDKLPMGLLTDPAKLLATLQYHVVPGRLYAADVLAAGTLTTLTGQVLKVTQVGGTVYINGYSAVLTPDIDCLNGVVHIVDSVVEASVVSLVDVAIAAGYSTLVSLVTTAGLAPTFASNATMNAFTLLAPSNAAFVKLSGENPNVYSWVSNARNVAGLMTVLQYHAAPMAVYKYQLTAGPITMVNGQEVTAAITPSVTFTDNQVPADVALVVSADNAAYNGVLHGIDTVLLPTGVVPVNDVPTAVSQAGLSQLVTALTTAGLVPTLSAPNGPFTVFAPVNAAFDKLPAGLLTDVSKLTTTLQYHVVLGRLYAADVIAAGSIRTLTGQVLNITQVGGKVYVNGYSQITFPDNLDCLNGVVHLVDTVIEANVVSLLDVAAASAGLSKLVMALNKTGLSSVFSNVAMPNALTLLAPSDAAFGLLDANTLSWLLGSPAANVQGLASVLSYHVVPTAVYSFQLAAGPVTMLNGQTVMVALMPTVFSDNLPTPTKAGVTLADQAAYNGVAHVIDHVLIPTGLALPSDDLVGVASATPDLSSLVAQITNAGLGASLVKPNGPFTVIAPYNAAFTSFDPSKFSTAGLLQLLQFHVIVGRYYAADFVNGTTYNTLAGQPVTFYSGPARFVGGQGTVTRVVTADVDSFNAAIHVVDSVLEPSGDAPKKGGSSTAAVSGLAVAATLVTAAVSALAGF